MLVQSLRSKRKYTGVKQLFNILLLIFVAQILPVNADCSMDHAQPATEISDHSGHNMGHSIESMDPNADLSGSAPACDCCDASSCDMLNCNNLALTSAALIFSGKLQPSAIVAHRNQTHLAPDSPSRLRPPIAS
ncbi:hypothetical protein U062_01196 [Gammaproteobacteria bacterium MOLA455]|nr:hypothetical protein U062_01196 [Gammaproteobacteria bacterium MOLA455]